MALTKNMTFSGTSVTSGSGWRSNEAAVDYTVAGCYIKVERVDGGKTSCTAYVSFAAEGFSGAKNYAFVPSVADDAANFIKQAYEHLKTLDEFAGAVDVLEAGQTA